MSEREMCALVDKCDNSMPRVMRISAFGSVCAISFVASHTRLNPISVFMPKHEVTPANIVHLNSGGVLECSNKSGNGCGRVCSHMMAVYIKTNYDVSTLASIYPPKKSRKRKGAPGVEDLVGRSVSQRPKTGHARKSGTKPNGNTNRRGTAQRNRDRSPPPQSDPEDDYESTGRKRCSEKERDVTEDIDVDCEGDEQGEGSGDEKEREREEKAPQPNERKKEQADEEEKYEKEERKGREKNNGAKKKAGVTMRRPIGQASAGFEWSPQGAQTGQVAACKKCKRKLPRNEQRVTFWYYMMDKATKEQLPNVSSTAMSYSPCMKLVSDMLTLHCR